MELCLGRGAAPRPPEDGSAQSPLSEVLGVSEPTSVWSPCRALPRPSRRLFLSLAACVLVRGSPPPWLPLQQEPVAASGPGAGAGSGKEAGGGNSGLTWGMSCLAPGWLRGVSFSHTLLHTCLSQRAAASWDFFPSFFFFFFFFILNHLYSWDFFWDDRCGPAAPCTLVVPGVWVCLELSEAHGTCWTRLVGFYCGGAGFFISEPSSGEKGGETHPAGKREACEQGPGWGPLLPDRCTPGLTCVGLRGVSCHPERLQRSCVHGCRPAGRRVMETWLRMGLLLCVCWHL